ncbi:MAG TPA: hypothetical protein PKY15_01245 [Methanoregulaceae archaeon]|nr:hypothetical protein [Methanoregulaceae archaeon]MDD5049679.1 hypothetical protein [Methanoregulaceae archaeon]HQC11969.1 hypothetical protein [Methanoregulaceae archaeon]HRX33550.1 hypothetical protein [Methanoregulaceae archaeon]
MKRSMIIIIALAFITGSVLAVPTVSMYGETMNKDHSGMSLYTIPKSDECMCGDLFVGDDGEKAVHYLCSAVFDGADCPGCSQTQGPEYITDPETGYVYSNTFANGSVIPEDFVDPVHGADSISDPRNIVLYRPWPTHTLVPIQPHDEAEILARLDHYSFPLPTWTGSTRVLGRLAQFI